MHRNDHVFNVHCVQAQRSDHVHNLLLNINKLLAQTHDHVRLMNIHYFDLVAFGRRALRSFVNRRSTRKEGGSGLRCGCPSSSVCMLNGVLWLQMIIISAWFRKKRCRNRRRCRPRLRVEHTRRSLRGTTSHSRDSVGEICRWNGEIATGCRCLSDRPSNPD